MNYNIAVVEGDGIGPEVVSCRPRRADRSSGRRHKFDVYI